MNEAVETLNKSLQNFKLTSRIVDEHAWGGHGLIGDLSTKFLESNLVAPNPVSMPTINHENI